jgi:hypothetical protein
MVRKSDYLGQIVIYIKKNLKKGYTKDALRFALQNQDHSKFEIERAFNQAEKELAREAPVLKTKPTIKYEIVNSNNIANPELRNKGFWKRLFG